MDRHGPCGPHTGWMQELWARSFRLAEDPCRLPIQAGGVAVPPVVADAGLTLFLRPAVEVLPLARVVEEGRAPSARSLYLCHGEVEHLPCAGRGISSHAALRGCTAHAVPYKRRISGGPSKAANMTVMRGCSKRCAAVALPLPVTLDRAPRFGPSTRKVSMPLGERFTLPSAAVAARKNSFFAVMKLHRGPMTLPRSLPREFPLVGGGSLSIPR